MAWKMRTIKATRGTLPAGFKWFPQQMMESEKVEALRIHIRAGGNVPPVVVARYGNSFMPIDGHHRCDAHSAEGLPLDAWIVSGSRFDALDEHEYRACNQIDCGGVPAMSVAKMWATHEKS